MSHEPTNGLVWALAGAAAITIANVIRPLMCNRMLGPPPEQLAPEPPAAGHYTTGRGRAATSGEHITPFCGFHDSVPIAAGDRKVVVEHEGAFVRVEVVEPLLPGDRPVRTRSWKVEPDAGATVLHVNRRGTAWRRLACGRNRVTLLRPLTDDVVIPGEHHVYGWRERVVRPHARDVTLFR